GVPRADLFVAVTPIESVNIHACILAANLGARKTVARVDSNETMKPENADFYKKIGISRLVYPELLGGTAVASAIHRTWARSSHELCGGSLLLLCVKVYGDSSHPIIGKTMIEIGKSFGKFHVAAIIRGEDVIIPRGSDTIEAEDQVYFIVTPENDKYVRLACKKKETHINRVVFVGGTRLGIQASRLLPEEMSITFINHGQKEAEYLKNKVPSAVIVDGNSTSLDEWNELGLGATDAVVALGDNSGENVLACLMAKKLKVGKTVVEVEDVDYITIADKLNIGSVINKKILTASDIYQLLLKSDKTSAKTYSIYDAEVAEFIAQPNSKITQKPVMQLGLSRNISLGGLARNGKGMTITGQTTIQPGDQVVVIFMDQNISQIEKLFI
ncbi:MAG: Trk system potassium transporter TrkA, partial [Bacteroidales bacterium]|nr:Trk system potassium transporter TrkA [Bacteroidales bacterium]